MTAAFSDLLPLDVVETVRASRHLAAMSRERRAQLEREWLEAERTNDRAVIEAELRQIVQSSSGAINV